MIDLLTASAFDPGTLGSGYLTLFVFIPVIVYEWKRYRNKPSYYSNADERAPLLPAAAEHEAIVDEWQIHPAELTGSNPEALYKTVKNETVFKVLKYVTLCVALLLVVVSIQSALYCFTPLASRTIELGLKEASILYQTV